MPAQLRGRSMLVVRADMIAIECVVRGYLSGSGWKEYKANGSVCGIKLPAGLRESDKLPEPIFTPAIKATSGHDENISFEHMVTLAGRELSEKLRDLSIQVYQTAADYAETRGIIIADTKFEFGRTPADWCWPTRCLRRIRHASGRKTSISRAVRRTRSISSTSVTTWKPSSGTNSRQLRLYLRKWRPEQAKNMSRLIPN